jgi:lipoprotein-anchoring transpeptidase ErfK/SrfK
MACDPMRADVAAYLVFVFLASPAAADSLDIRAVNDARWPQQKFAKSSVSPLLIKAQVLLDRAHFSPGEIDGKPGDNFNKAVAAFAAENGLGNVNGLTEELWQRLTESAADPVLTEYKLLDGDVRGPFIKKIPAKMEEMKDLPALPYTSPREKIAEKFHMSEALLTALNPGQRFEREGDTIVVANVSEGSLPTKAARIEIDKTGQTLKAFDRNQKLIAFYPATAGSTEKPAPSGRLKVTAVAHNPTYRYNPDYAFKGVHASEPFTINPGPNNPVGVVWIGLSGEGYGIHGTPDPSKISKTESHGCIRLTNWDALQLAAAVAKGTAVDFIGDEQTARKARAEGRRGRERRRL